MEERDEMETRVALLVTSVERLSQSVDTLTKELRETNAVVQSQHTEFKLADQMLQRVKGEIWTSDNMSRIRALELQVRGLFVLVGFLCLTLFGRLLPLILQNWVAGLKP